MFYYLYAVAGLALLASFIANRNKTLKALKVATKRFINILPAFIAMLVLISIVLFLIPDEMISRYLGTGNKSVGVLLAAVLGSVTLMPGFIAFPLSGILLQKGVAYTVIATFTTTLMMVGVLTYPIEKAYFGPKLTVLRNTIGLLIALCVAVVIGIFYGEIF
jgi:uncharacterized membrane protein YraQ (UPF0718 family)